MSADKKCPSCETVKPLMDFYIQRARGGKPSSYCRACSRIKDRSPKSRFAQARAKARSREVEWHLSFDQFLVFLGAEACTYCGGPLPQTGCGIDRVNEKLPYTVENCIPSCAACNFMKHSTYKHHEMVLLGETVRKIRTLRGLGPKEYISTPSQAGKKRREYRPRRKGGAKVHGHLQPLPARKDENAYSDESTGEP